MNMIWHDEKSWKLKFPLWSTKPNFHRKFSNGCGLTPPVCNASLTVCSTVGEYAIINIFSIYICTIHLLYMETSKYKIQGRKWLLCHSTKQVSRNMHLSKIKTNYYLVYIYLLTSKIFPSMPLADWQHSAKSTFWRFSSDSYTKTTHTLYWAKLEKIYLDEEKHLHFSHLEKKLT